MDAYLRVHKPKRAQFRSPRRKRPTGLTVIHTAENVFDALGEDTGAEGIARFMQGRSDPGSYHDIVDTDSSVHLVDYTDEAYQDGTGSNPFAMSISFACRAADWPHMSEDRRADFLRNGAGVFARQQAWLASKGYPTTTLRRISKDQSDKGLSGFIAHGDRDPGRRSDPGPAFPWKAFFEACEIALGIKKPAPVITATPPPVLVPTLKEIDMLLVLDADNVTQFICTDKTARQVNVVESAIYRTGGVKLVGKDDAKAEHRGAFIAGLRDLETNPT